MRHLSSRLVLFLMLCLALFAVPLRAQPVEHTVEHLLDRAITGLQGKRILLQFEDQSELRVLNTETGQFEPPIRLIEQEALVAAGGKLALIYYPDARIFETWDLETGSKLKAKPSTLGREIVTIAMARDVDQRALLVLKQVSGKKTALVQLDTDVLTAIAGTEAETNFNAPQYLSLTPDFTLGIDSERRGRMNSFRISPTSTEWIETIPNPQHNICEQESRLQIMPQGRGYVSNRQWSDGSLTTTAELFEMFPSIDFDYFVQVYEKPYEVPLLLELQAPERLKPVMVLYDRHMTPLWSKPHPIDQVKHAVGKRTGSVIKRLVWAVPETNKLVALDSIRYYGKDRKNHETIIAVTTLDARLPASATIRPGQAWSADMSHLSDEISIALEYAPDGVTFDRTTKKLQWQVPATFTQENVTILIRLSKIGQRDHLIRYHLSIPVR